MPASSASFDPARDLRAAIRFLTIVPVAARGDEGFGAAVFPLVGLLIGLVTVAVAGVLGFFGTPFVEIAIVVASIVLTGGLHLDGLADTGDGLGGRTPEDRLRCMAEGSIGTFGVLALLVAFSLRLGALVTLPAEARWVALVVAPTIARTAMLGAAFGMPTARPGGLGAAFVAAISAREIAVACAIAAFVAVVIGGVRGFLALGIAAAVALAMRALARRRLGGTTGDVLGATGEIAEVLALGTFAIGAIA